jgi:opine dehydrogenase
MTAVHPTPPRRVAVVGAGPVGCATAAYLHAAGHAVALWSPTGARLRHAQGAPRIAATGALAHEFTPRVLDAPATLADYDTWIVCLPANAYESVLGALAEHWRDGQIVLVSGALALSPLWLADEAAARGADVCIAGWNTTPTTTHFLPDGRLHVNPLRQRIEVAGVGAAATARAVAESERLLGARFAAARDLLAITLANVNPIAHAAEVLPNLTRIDRGETWSLFGCFTPVVARMAEALDAERLAVARAFGLDLPTLREHYTRSYHLDAGPLHALAAQIEQRGMSPSGPATLAHRYVLEDGPFGMAFLESLARLAQVPTPVLSASITLLSAGYARDLRADNFLVERLGLAATSPAALQARCAAERSAATAGRRALPAR